MNFSIEQALEKEGFLIRPVSGDSMMPMLDQRRDAVKIVPVSVPLKKYDLPLYRRPGGQYVLHRIIALRKRYCVTCGDNRWRSEKVPYEWIVGIAEGYFKDGKYISCRDREYVKYVRRRCRGRIFRIIYGIAGRLFGRKKGRDMEERKEAESSTKAEEKYLISLLRAALRNEDAVCAPPGLNWKKVYLLAEKQLIAATVYRAVEKSGVCPEEVLRKWKASADAALRKELLFDGARREIFLAFDEQKIDYLPLKGILIKSFYPRKGMRQFADNDVLYKEKDHKKVKIIMESLGYKSEGLEAVHDVYMKDPVYNFELHRSLFDDRQEFFSYFEEVWSRAVKEEGENCAYRMTEEDFYIYFLAHFKKHYTNSGTGLRSFADLYLLRRNLSLNGEYVRACLQATGMEAFEREVLEISDMLFGDEPRDLPEKTSCYIFSSGAYGSAENAVRNKMEKKGRVRGFLEIIFPPFKSMRINFPILRRLPFLLPVLWLVRLIRGLFSRRKWKRVGFAIKTFFKKGE